MEVFIYMGLTPVILGSTHIISSILSFYAVAIAHSTSVVLSSLTSGSGTIFLNQYQCLESMRKYQDEAPHPRQGIKLSLIYHCPSHIYLWFGLNVVSFSILFDFELLSPIIHAYYNPISHGKLLVSPFY